MSLSDSDSLLRVTREPGGVVQATLNRPRQLNALNRDLVEALLSLAHSCRDDREARVLVITGAGRAFSAGADIGAMGSLDAGGMEAFLELGHRAMDAIENLPIPAIAAVNGPALGGGCELALACDLILAADSAFFGLPELELGIIPGWGGTVRMPRRVGTSRAREILLTGRRVPAPEALAIGLCDQVHPAGTLAAATEELAVRLAGRDPAAVAAARLALRRQAELEPAEAAAVERRLFVELFDRPERAAAFERFFQRRQRG